jgi:hypothetical protein
VMIVIELVIAVLSKLAIKLFTFDENDWLW